MQCYPIIHGSNLAASELKLASLGRVLKYFGKSVSLVGVQVPTQDTCHQLRMKSRRHHNFMPLITVDIVQGTSSFTLAP